MKQITFGLGGYDPKKKNNNIVEELDLPDPPQQPLNHVGALATLLVVTGVLDLQDGANAVGLNPDQLIAEAQAWHIAKTV